MNEVSRYFYFEHRVIDHNDMNEKLAGGGGKEKKSQIFNFRNVGKLTF